jgi:hypothetical protein
VLKYRLYSINKQALSTFRLLRLNSPLSEDDLISLEGSIRRLEQQLSDWRKNIPGFLTMDYYDRFRASDPSSQPRDREFQNLDENDRKLLLQALTLQILDDSSLIFFCRPLLEHRVSTKISGQASLSALRYRKYVLGVAVEAALRISRMPMKALENSLALSFLFIHFFTAAAVLCIIPPNEPFSTRAQESKTGVLRIIQASRTLRDTSNIAKHANELLTALLGATTQRELKNALGGQESGREGSPVATAFDAPEILPRASVQHLTTHDRNQPLSAERDMPLENDHVTINVSVPKVRDGPPTDQQYPTGASPAAYTATSFASLDDYGFQFDGQLDETFGAFGQSKYFTYKNMMPAYQTPKCLIE